MVFGLAPAWRAVRHGVRDAFIVAQLALSLVLLAGALFTRSLHNLESEEAGFQASDVLLVLIVALAAGYLPARRAARLDPAAVLRE